MTRGVLSGRTAIVASAGHGIGHGAAATSCALSRAGASVVLAARDARALEALAAHLEATGGQVVAVPTDLASPVSVRRLVEQTLGAFGRLDAACNAIACTGRRATAGDAVPRATDCADCAGACCDDAAQVRAMSSAVRYETEAMRRSGGGRVVNLTSCGGSRAAVIELTRKAALDLAGFGVRVNAVVAGPAAGPVGGPVGGPEGGTGGGAGGGPGGEPGGGAGGVARAVLWLCRDAAVPIGGEVLHIPSAPCCDAGRDGGRGGGRRRGVRGFAS